MTAVNNGIGPVKTYTYQTDQLKDCLDRRDFDSIIKTKELFWIAHCHALWPSQSKVIEVKNVMTVKSTKTLFQEIQKIVELFRQKFAAGLESHLDVEINIKKNNEIEYDISGNGSEKFNQKIYTGYIAPALAQLAEFCGANYIKQPCSTEFTVKTEFKVEKGLVKGDLSSTLIEVQKLQFIWNNLS